MTPKVEATIHKKLRDAQIEARARVPARIWTEAFAYLHLPTLNFCPVNRSTSMAANICFERRPIGALNVSLPSMRT